MTFDAKATGTRIYHLRRAKALTAVKIARELGMSEGTYRKIESGERGMSVSNLLLICEYFDVSTDYILKGELPYCPADMELTDIIERLRKLKEKLELPL